MFKLQTPWNDLSSLTYSYSRFIIINHLNLFQHKIYASLMWCSPWGPQNQKVNKKIETFLVRQINTCLFEGFHKAFLPLLWEFWKRNLVDIQCKLGDMRWIFFPSSGTPCIKFLFYWKFFAGNAKFLHIWLNSVKRDVLLVYG